SPYLLLVGSLLTVAFGLWIGELVITGLAGTLQFSYWWFSAYVVAFGPSMLFGASYWQQEHSLSWLKAIIVFHVFALYATLWYLPGWRAVFRLLTGRTGWTKTDRIKEPVKDTGDATVTALSAGGGASWWAWSGLGTRSQRRGGRWRYRRCYRRGTADGRYAQRIGRTAMGRR